MCELPRSTNANFNFSYTDFQKCILLILRSPLFQMVRRAALFAAKETFELLQNLDAPLRCHALAEASLSVEKGVNGRMNIYKRI